MVDYEYLKQFALDYGFDQVGDPDVNSIEVHPEVRDSCVENKCRVYNKTWD